MLGKLKRGGANFNLDQVLQWGSLPKLLELPDAEEKNLFLKSYIKTYLKEEIVAAQTNG